MAPYSHGLLDPDPYSEYASWCYNFNKSQRKKLGLNPQITSKTMRNRMPNNDNRNVGTNHEVTKRCRLSLLTNSSLVYESECGGWGGVAGSRTMSTAVHIT
jgi:hypothetical protein